MSKHTDSQNTKPSANTSADATMSRSEIESALVGDKFNQKSVKRRIEPNTILNVPPRRQQVLGGDLSGISSRPRSLSHKLTDVSVVNWLVGLIVLAIIGAFFWPQSQPSVTEVPAQQQLVEIERDALVEEVEIIEEEDSGFSRDNDLARANDYRQQDAQELQIRDLLSQAQEFTSKRQFTVPKNANAISSYKAVLAIDPKNVAAQQGLRDIKEHFQFKALKALEDKNEELARESLGRLEQVETESEEALFVVAALEEYELKKRLDSLLANANAAQKKDQLILPASDNALYYYQQAIQIDPENSTAKKGIKTVADAYIQKANDAVLDGDFNRANAHLATVSVIDSRHNSIPLIEAMIARAKPLAEAAAKERESNRAIAAQQDSLDDSMSGQLASQTTETSSEQAIAPATPQQGTSRTPPTQSREQAAIDQSYLENGLDAYYRGEYERAATLLQPLSDKGIARAQFRLGYMHYLGRGFARDRQRADQIIRAALPAIQKFAEQGRAWAQSDLGSLYEDGLVLRRDYGEAVYWYRSAAEQGYPGAQTNLGIMYARGRGVAASRRTAVEWFQRAAKQGDIAARRNLSSMGIN